MFTVDVNNNTTNQLKKSVFFSRQHHVKNILDKQTVEVGWGGGGGGGR